MKSLVAVGAGYGNIVMATPTIRAMQSMGATDVTICKTSGPDAHELFADWANVVKMPEPSHYDAIIQTVWSDGHWGAQRNTYAPDRALNGTVHESLVNMTAAYGAGFVGDVPEPMVGTIRPEQFLDDEPFVAICPGCGGGLFWERKRWGGWESLCAGLEARGERVIILARAEDFAPWMNGYRMALGTLSIGEVAFVLGEAKCVVGIDNGLAHIAAALRKRTTVIFGATSEIKNRPIGGNVTVIAANIECRPCQMDRGKWDACKDWRCMEISVEMVLGAI